jgi:vancomycin resistance protein YoaR
MKKYIAFVALIACSCQTESETAKQPEQQVAKSQIEALAKKHGVQIVVKDAPTDPKARAVTSFPPMTMEQLDKEMAEMAALQKSGRVVTEQSEKLMKEMREKKFVTPSEYFVMLEKYPELKAANVQMMGGEQGFETYKADALRKEAKGLYKKPQN